MDASEYLPLKPAQYLTLLLLAREPSFGVELLERLEEASGGAIRLNAGSLYRLLARLVDAGLVEPVGEEANPAGVGAPRKHYVATKLGRAVVRAEAERQSSLVEMARSLDLLGEG